MKLKKRKNLTRFITVWYNISDNNKQCVDVHIEDGVVMIHKPSSICMTASGAVHKC